MQLGDAIAAWYGAMLLDCCHVSRMARFDDLTCSRGWSPRRWC